MGEESSREKSSISKSSLVEKKKPKWYVFSLEDAKLDESLQLDGVKNVSIGRGTKNVVLETRISHGWP